MNNAIAITFYGGVGTVTGANFMLEIAGKKVLVDCGLLQGEKFASQENRKDFPFNPSEIDMLFVTHAHLDHVGRIGKLIKDGFKGKIYSTPETMSIARLIMEDACGLLAREAAQNGVLPLYEPEDVRVALSMWNTILYHTETEIDGFSVYLKDAGHILGSAMIEFRINGKKIVFTGDLGNSPTPLLKDTEVIDDATYMVMESVYGDRNHEPPAERTQKLKKIINDTIKRGGAVVIPAFSLERTQVILYELNNLVEKGEIPHVPFFVDSPLATKITEIYRTSTEHFNPKVQEAIKKGDDIFNFPRLKYTATGIESRAIQNTPNPKVIIAGSGMSVGGRVIYHEEHFLDDERSTILLVGYQSLGTLGRALQNGGGKVKINGVERNVRVKVETISGFSAHKDSEHLIAFVENTKETVKKVFCVMGEPKSSMFLVQRLRDFLGVDAVYPKKGERFEFEI